METLPDLFIRVLNMSITASYIIAAVLLIRFALRKAPKIFSYLLWSVVGFRLVCPVSFSSMLSLFNARPFDLSAAQTAAGTLDHVPAAIGNMPAPQISVGIPALSNAISNSLPVGNATASVNPLQVIDRSHDPCLVSCCPGFTGIQPDCFSPRPAQCNWIGTPDRKHL
jgi:hypothetical protein